MMNGNTIAKVLAYASLLALIMPAASAAIVPAKSGTYFYAGDYFDKAFGEAKPVVTVSPKSGCMMFTDSNAFHAEFGIVKSAEKLTIRQLPLEEEQLAPEASGTKPTENEISPEIVVIPVAAEALANRTGNGTNNGLDVEIVAEPKGEEILTGEEEAGTIENETSLVATEKSAEDETLITGAVVSKGLPMQAVVIGVLIVIIVIMLVVLLVRKEPGGAKRAAKKAKPEKKPKIEKEDVWEEGTFFKEAVEKRETKRNGNSNEKGEVKPFLLKIKDETS